MPGARAARFGAAPPSRFVVPMREWLAQQVGATGSGTTWPAANVGIYLPFSEPTDVNVTSVVVYCTAGVSAGRTWDVGFYNADTLAKVKTQGAVDVITNLNTWAPAGGVNLLGGQRYYLAMSANNTALAFWARAPSAVILRTLGFAQQSTVATLPDPIVPGQIGNAYLPLLVANFANLVS